MGNRILNKQTRLRVVVALDKDDINYETDLHVKHWFFKNFYSYYIMLRYSCIKRVFLELLL